MRSLFSIVLLMFFTLTAFGHDDDDSPGSLPPPPNGGRIAAAEESSEQTHADNHEGPELFVEGKLQATTLRLYPILLDPKRPMVFQNPKPDAKLKLVELKINLPRSKKTFNVNFKKVAEYWEAETGPIKDRRLLIYPTFEDAGVRKTARIQIEK